MNKTVSIILCTFNEVNHIEKCLDLIKKNLNNVQVIIVDDNSSDGTIEKLDQLKYKFSFELYVRKKVRGLAGAILDVFSPEPIEPSSKLWDTPNLVITPHVSADDGESYVRLTLELFVKNLELFIANKPLVNQIDKKLGY